MNVRVFLVVAMMPGLLATVPGVAEVSNQEKVMSEQRAEGTFEVSMQPDGDAGKADEADLGKMALDKQYSGDLEATARGFMLTAMTETEGSAGYVAQERVSGTLAGREGGFVLQHWGMMDRGAQELQVRIVPDSGSGELNGISGELSIRIEDGVHYYTLDYHLPESGD